MKRHRRNRHEGIRFKCNYCDYDAGQKGNIKSHMDRKHPEIPYDHTEFQEVKVEKSKYTTITKMCQLGHLVAGSKRLFPHVRGLGSRFLLGWDEPISRDMREVPQGG